MYESDSWRWLQQGPFYNLALMQKLKMLLEISYLGIQRTSKIVAGSFRETKMACIF